MPYSSTSQHRHLKTPPHSYFWLGRGISLQKWRKSCTQSSVVGRCSSMVSGSTRKQLHPRPLLFALSSGPQLQGKGNCLLWPPRLWTEGQVGQGWPQWWLLPCSVVCSLLPTPCFLLFPPTAHFLTMQETFVGLCPLLSACLQPHSQHRQPGFGDCPPALSLESPMRAFSLSSSLMSSFLVSSDIYLPHWLLSLSRVIRMLVTICVFATAWWVVTWASQLHCLPLPQWRHGWTPVTPLPWTWGSRWQTRKSLSCSDLLLKLNNSRHWLLSNLSTVPNEPPIWQPES
jgi:hypothetical protein